MTALDWTAAHPWLALALLVVGGWSVGGALAAPVTAWKKLPKRKGDCPRCNGTGREP